MMVWDLDITRQALRVENRKVERLQSCLSAVEMALTVADRETTATEATTG